jgi:hypothetical protein
MLGQNRQDSAGGTASLRCGPGTFNFWPRVRVPAGSPCKSQGFGPGCRGASHVLPPKPAPDTADLPVGRANCLVLTPSRARAQRLSTRRDPAMAAC